MSNIGSKVKNLKEFNSTSTIGGGGVVNMCFNIIVSSNSVPDIIHFKESQDVKRTQSTSARDRGGNNLCSKHQPRSNKD